ncbi:hypothetical protein [Nonomuraea salmonea]|uniref:hypothetical protein n=1 Tax=Nonomuraea salmonea TaxID=46181 RepID=UPI002FE84EFD
MQISKAEGELAQSMLAQIGVKLSIKAVPSDDFFTKYVIPGNFDITPFAYIGTPFPVSSSYGIYANATNGQNWNANFGRTGSPEIDQAMSRAAQTLDPARARAATNEADKLLWPLVNVLPLYQRPQLVAVRASLANVGGARLLRPPVRGHRLHRLSPRGPRRRAAPGAAASFRAVRWRCRPSPGRRCPGCPPGGRSARSSTSARRTARRAR